MAGTINGILQDMTDQINLDEAREYVLKLLPQVKDTLKNYFTSGNLTSTSKGGVDFLTQADKEINTFLLENLKKMYPQSFVLAEETTPSDFFTLKELDNVWIVDPIDGTCNFSRGNPNFAISVGLVDKGIPKLGIIFVPMTGELFWAQKDIKGAFRNGEQIRISSIDKVGETVAGFGWPWNLQRRLTMTKMLDKISMHVRQLQALGSAAADLAGLAKGDIDVYIHSGLKPWDTAASALLIEKAGGKITTPGGAKWNVFEPEILATNGILHNTILKLLKKNY